jgi:FMN-dependent NADH-azoreductase
MINFGISSLLKAWVDLVLRSGITFRYGPEGLLSGKKAYLVLASGGVYSEGPMQALDHQAPYLHAALSFIGITDITTVRIEGVAYGPEAAQLAVDAAKANLAELVTIG